MKIVNSLDEIKDFIKDNKMALIMFSTDTCSVCVDLTPKMEDLVKRYPKLDIIKVDMNSLTEAAGEYSIFTIPSVLLFIDEKETIRRGRFISIDDLDANISRYYEMLLED